MLQEKFCHLWILKRLIWEILIGNKIKVGIVPSSFWDIFCRENLLVIFLILMQEKLLSLARLQKIKFIVLIQKKIFYLRIFREINWKNFCRVKSSTVCHWRNFLFKYISLLKISSRFCSCGGEENVETCKISRNWVWEAFAWRNSFSYH